MYIYERSNGSPAAVSLQPLLAGRCWLLRSESEVDDDEADGGGEERKRPPPPATTRNRTGVPQTRRYRGRRELWRCTEKI